MLRYPSEMWLEKGSETTIPKDPQIQVAMLQVCPSKEKLRMLRKELERR